MAIRASARYVQPFTTGLSQLLSNSIGAYGPTIAITHFLPVYIPSLQNDDFGGPFKTLFTADTDIASTGFNGEPIWLPDDNKRYDFKVATFDKFSNVVNVAATPTSVAVASDNVSALWENAVVSGDIPYSLSKFTDGLTGTEGWMFEHESAFYDYNRMLKRDNLFPIKDYESPMGEDNTVCGRYIVGFKDIGAKLGLDTGSERLKNIIKSKFVFNAVILYGFKVLAVSPTEDGQVSYNLDTTAIPIAVAGIEGQPIALNMDKMDSQGNDWDSVWNIDIDFIPYKSVGDTQVNNVTHRIVAEWSYWTKNQPDMLHSNNRVHIGMTVEPYGNNDQTNTTAAWLHISNKLVDPENFNIGNAEDYTRVAMDRRHIRMDADKTLMTMEVKDIGDTGKGVVDLRYYAVDMDESGGSPALDITNPFLQANGGKAYGNNDMAIGVGVVHDKTENAISFGKHVTFEGAGYKNVVTIGEKVSSGDNLMKSDNKNVVSIGDNHRNRGSNIIKVGQSDSGNGNISDERNIVVVGDGQDSYVKMRSSVLVGSGNSFDSVYGDANYVNGEDLLVLGDGNEMSTGDMIVNGSKVSSYLSRGEIVGDDNKLFCKTASLVNFDVKGTTNAIYLSGGLSSNLKVVGDENYFDVGAVSNVDVCGYKNRLLKVDNKIKLFGDRNDVRGSSIYVDGSDNKTFGTANNLKIVGDTNTIGQYVAYKSEFSDEIGRYGRNIFGIGNRCDIGGGLNVLFAGDTLVSRENVNSVYVGQTTTVNTMKESIIGTKNSVFDIVRNSIAVGRNMANYGSSSVLGSVSICNTLMLGTSISLADGDGSSYYDGVKYASVNSVVVGETMDLKNVENGIYVGSNIRSYGRQGFAIGRNIFLHKMPNRPVGHLGAIGTDINFGAFGNDLTAISNFGIGENFTTMIVGDSIYSSDSNKFFNSISTAIGSSSLRFASLPSMILGNNVYGNNSFAPSRGAHLIRIGKWVQNREIVKGSNLDITVYREGTRGWKFPFASLDSLSNSTEFRVNLPVLNFNRVFGSSILGDTIGGFNTNDVVVFDGNGMNDMQNCLFLDEYGFVRSATSRNMSGRKEMVDIWGTLLYKSAIGYANNTMTTTNYSSFKAALNLILDFLRTDVAFDDHEHFNYMATYPSVGAHMNMINTSIAGVEWLKQAVNELNMAIYTSYYASGSCLMTTHSANIHNVSSCYGNTHYPTSANTPLRDCGTLEHKVSSTIRAIWYYLNNSVVSNGTKHSHVPCIIESLT